MRRYFSLLTAIAAYLPVGTPTLAATGEELVDRIVAVVNGHPVLNSEVDAKVKIGPLVVVSDFPADESSSAWDRALQDAVNFELVMAKAKDMDIDVRDDEVDAEIKTWLEGRGVTREALDQHLATQNTTYDQYREDFRDQMVLRQFQGRVITPLVKITDKDVETFYLKKTGASSDMLELVMRQILVSAPASSPDDVIEAKRRLTQEVHQKLTDGMAFIDAVKVYSDEGSARENGGLMPPVRLKDLAGQVRAEVESLDTGKFSAPVRSPVGFHIFFIEEKRLAGSSEFLSRKRQLEGELRMIEVGNQTRRWLTEQRQKSKIEMIP